MSKIIIHNDTDESDKYIAELVCLVMAGGLVSGLPNKPQYCYVTTFTSSNGTKVLPRITCSRKGDTHTFKASSVDASNY